jgi:hypothetical protein
LVAKEKEDLRARARRMREARKMRRMMMMMSRREAGWFVCLRMLLHGLEDSEALFHAWSSEARRRRPVGLVEG